MEKLNAETLDTLFANPNVQNMAELIGKYESNNQYDINVGGAKIDISDGSKHPRQFDVKTKEGKSSAAGRYQITSTTFDDITSQNPQAEITDFSPTFKEVMLLSSFSITENALLSFGSSSFILIESIAPSLFTISATRSLASSGLSNSEIALSSGSMDIKAGILAPLNS